MYIGISKQRVYQMNIFAKQLCIPKNCSISIWQCVLYPADLTKLCIHRSDKCEKIQIQFFICCHSACLVSLPPELSDRPVRKRRKCFHSIELGRDHSLTKVTQIMWPFSISHLSMTKMIWSFSISHWLRRIYVSASLYSSRPMRDRERSHNFCDLS